MAEEKHHHHLFHHHKEEECKPVDCKREEKHHKHKEHLGELSAVAAGAYALHEKHMAKKDPEHAHNHKIKEEVAVAVAVGAGGYAFHEHHEKKEAKKHHVGFMGANNRPLTRLGLLETHMEYVTGQPVALTLRRPLCTPSI